MEEETVKKKWKAVKEAVTSSRQQQAVGPKKYTHKNWISTETLEKTDKRKNRKAALNNSRTRSEKISTGNIQRDQKNGKKNIRADNRQGEHIWIAWLKRQKNSTSTWQYKSCLSRY